MHGQYKVVTFNFLVDMIFNILIKEKKPQNQVLPKMKKRKVETKSNKLLNYERKEDRLLADIKVNKFIF